MAREGFSLYTMLGQKSIVAERLNVKFVGKNLMEEGSYDLKKEVGIVKKRKTPFGFFTDLDTGKEYPLLKSNVIIGAALDADIMLTEHGQKTVSRHHAFFEKRENRFFITDNSLNGTFVAENLDYNITFRRLNKNEPFEVTDGQTIKFASKCLKFTCAESEEQFD